MRWDIKTNLEKLEEYLSRDQKEDSDLREIVDERNCFDSVTIDIVGLKSYRVGVQEYEDKLELMKEKNNIKSWDEYFNLGEEK